jgi:ribosomal protein S27E
MITADFKKDSFSKRRGGRSKFLDLYCKKCRNMIAIYQKDGPGPLYRCYADRIIWPKNLVPASTRYARDMPKLACRECGAVVGTPSRYRKHGENRLAFNMAEGSFSKRTSAHARIKAGPPGEGRPRHSALK